MGNNFEFGDNDFQAVIDLIDKVDPETYAFVGVDGSKVTADIEQVKNNFLVMVKFLGSDEPRIGDRGEKISKPAQPITKDLILKDIADMKFKISQGEKDQFTEVDMLNYNLLEDVIMSYERQDSFDDEE